METSEILNRLRDEHKTKTIRYRELLSMKLIYALFKWDRDSREDEIAAAGILNIAVNILIALAKIITGALASSIAIVSDGMNRDGSTATLSLTTPCASATRFNRSLRII